MSTRSPTLLDGRYAVEEQIATGGYSVVYRGRDVRFGLPVAIKILKDGGDRDSFRREARLARQFEHPHAVRVLDFGPGPGDSETPPYLVMEFLVGRTLKELAPTISGQRIRQFVQEIGGVLAFAHERGLAHRDFKPHNVVLDESRGAGQPRFVLLDFGIATQFDGTRSLQNHAANGLGTAPYMSPEQWRGEADQRADIYAFACVLFEVLAGTVPFPATGFPGTLEQYVSYVSSTPAPRLSAASPLCPMGEGVDRLLAQCLEKSPRNRPAQLAAVIGQFLSTFDADAYDRYRERRQQVVLGATGESGLPADGDSPTLRRTTVFPEAPLTDAAVPSRLVCQTVIFPDTDAEEAGDPAENTVANFGGAAVSAPLTPPRAAPATFPAPVPVPAEQSRDTRQLGGSTVTSGGRSGATLTAPGVPSTGAAAAKPDSGSASRSASPSIQASAPIDPSGMLAAGASAQPSTASAKRPSGVVAPVAWSVPVVPGTASPIRSNPAMPAPLLEKGTVVPSRSTTVSPPRPKTNSASLGKPVPRAAVRKIPVIEIAAALLAILATTCIGLAYLAAQRWERSVQAAVHAGDLPRAIQELTTISAPAVWLADRPRLQQELRVGVTERWKSLLAASRWTEGDLQTLRSLHAWLVQVDSGGEWTAPLQQAVGTRTDLIQRAVSTGDFRQADAIASSDGWAWLTTLPEGDMASLGWSRVRVLSEWTDAVLPALDSRASEMMDRSRLDELARRLDAALQQEAINPTDSAERDKLLALRERVTQALSNPATK